MYADKDKQREAVREAVRRHRAKGITKGITQIAREMPASVIPVIPEMPSMWGGPKDYEAWSPSPVVKRDFVVDDKPVPAWRVDKDRQMAEFLKRFG